MNVGLEPLNPSKSDLRDGAFKNPLIQSMRIDFLRLSHSEERFHDAPVTHRIFLTGILGYRRDTIDTHKVRAEWSACPSYRQCYDPWREYSQADGLHHPEGQ